VPDCQSELEPLAESTFDFSTKYLLNIDVEYRYNRAILGEPDLRVLYRVYDFVFI